MSDAVPGTPDFFQGALKAVAGSARPPVDPESGRALRMLFGGSAPTGADAMISPAAFQIRFGPKRPTGMALRFAPTIVGAVLDWCSIADARSGVVAAQVVLPEAFREPGVRGQDRLWLRSSPEEIHFSLRPPPFDDAAWPEPFRFEKRAPVPQFRIFTPMVECPYCHERIAKARILFDAMVCSSCARSFKVPAP